MDKKSGKRTKKEFNAEQLLSRNSEDICFVKALAYMSRIGPWLP